jgi:hypothetical protein
MKEFMEVPDLAQVGVQFTRRTRLFLALLC